MRCNVELFLHFVIQFQLLDYFSSPSSPDGRILVFIWLTTYIEKRGAGLVLGPRFEGLRITLCIEPSNARKPHEDVYGKVTHMGVRAA